jgi:hypothetical protein
MTTRLLITLSVLVAACSCSRSSSLPAPASLTVVAKNGSATPVLRGGADDNRAVVRVGAPIPEPLPPIPEESVLGWVDGAMVAPALVEGVAGAAAAGAVAIPVAAIAGIVAIAVAAAVAIVIIAADMFGPMFQGLYTTDRCRLDEELCFKGCLWFDPSSGAMNEAGSSDWCMSGGLVEGNMFCLVDNHGKIDWTCAGSKESSNFRPDGANPLSSFHNYTLLSIHVKRVADSWPASMWHAASHQMQVTQYAALVGSPSP